MTSLQPGKGARAGYGMVRSTGFALEVTLAQILTLPFPNLGDAGQVTSPPLTSASLPTTGTKYVLRKMAVMFARDNVPQTTGKL